MLYRNKGDGTFEDVTERAGVSSAQWTTAAAFADLDADGDQDLVAVEHGIWRAGGHQTAAALVVVARLDDLEAHAHQLAAFMDEGLGHVEVDDRDALVLGVFLLPRAGLHLLEAAAHEIGRAHV